MKNIYLSALTLFIGFSATTQIINPGFESWTTNAPDGWFQLNVISDYGDITDENGATILPAQQITTGSTEGTSYIKLTSFNLNASTAIIYPDGEYGSKIHQQFYSTDRYVHFKMDINYDIKPGDVGFIVIQANDINDNFAGTGVMELTGSQSNLSTITIPMMYTGTVTSYYIAVCSSKKGFVDNATEPIIPGSWIGVDNIVVGNIVGVAKEELKTKVNVSPNPATNIVHFKIDGLENGTITINSIIGQKVINTSFSNGIKQIDVSKLNNGVYIYAIRNANGEIVKTNKLIIRK